MTGKENGSSIPSYMSKEFFKNVLENGFKTKGIVVDNYSISAVGGGGENYTSELYCAQIKYSTPKEKCKEISLVVKDIQTEGKSRDLLNKMNVFNTEKVMYLEVVPKIEELLGGNISIAPKCFDTSETDSLLILQDLNALGFRLADRMKGMDEKHCELVLKKIGKFHAATMVLAKKDPPSVKRFKTGIFNEHSKDSDIIRGLFLANFMHMVSLIEQQ